MSYTIDEQLDILMRGVEYGDPQTYEHMHAELKARLQESARTGQGCLDLFRFLHNVHPFKRGKRAPHSPAQLVGLDMPDAPLTLLGLASKVLS